VTVLECGRLTGCDRASPRPIASARKPKERAARRTPVRRLSLLLNFPSVLVDA
jgi:hypothetical protein